MSDPKFPATSMPDREWWSALFPDPVAVLRRLGVEDGMTVLDLCCGDGLFTTALSEITQGRVYGLDVDPVLIARAKADLHAGASGALGWIVGDAREVATLLPARVDYVLIANTLHGVEEPASLLKEAGRILAPGGPIGVINWRTLPREQTPVLGEPRGPASAMRMSADALKAEFACAGLTAGAPIDLPPYHYGLVATLTGPSSRKRI
ncbi:MAG: methyltransferase [Lysobacterales bacterium RIFOXYA1_FULL_69_10]|jgi:SAM-dependent methyltransferase|nr:MAG: methyltransferase [Caulobacterales bacterium RIFCSPHIGHO2_12_FULL_68_13]OHE84297.1 MAG: methyltransferase [Xanthomonadales bacterium RIFOXYA1_FULL_69_10]